MIVYVVCFDIEDDKARREVGNLLGHHGRRVQKSVFEVMFKNNLERIRIEDRARQLLGSCDLLYFYRLCANCQKNSQNQLGEPLARFPRTVVI